MRKSLAVLALALAAIFATPTAALAGGGYEEPTVGTGTVSTGTVSAGGVVEFCGDGFAPGSDVEIAVDGTVVGTVVADGDGSFCVDLELSDTGTAVLTATGTGPNGATRTVTAQVTVTRAAAAPVRSGGRTGSDVSSLPRTGADGTATQVWAGIGLLGLGGGLVALTVAKRRETTPA